MKFFILSIIILLSSAKAEVNQSIIITNIAQQEKIIPYRYRAATVRWAYREPYDEFHVRVWIADKRTHYNRNPDYVYVTKNRGGQKIFLPKTGWAKINVIVVHNKISSDPSTTFEFLDSQLMRGAYRGQSYEK